MARSGADDFLQLSKALKHAGQGDLRKALNKGLRDAVKPLIPKTRAAALRDLPSSGGLARKVARSPQRVQVRTGRNPGVRLVVGKSGSGARATNQGVVRHPVFGNPDVWVDQKVPAGWFDDTIRREVGTGRRSLTLRRGSTVHRDIERTLQGVADQVIREAKRG